MKDTVQMNEAVKATLLARVYGVAQVTPCEPAAGLSAQVGGQIYLKREDLQPVHSFKIRGAYNKMVNLTAAERANGVIAASAGNHAQGVALSAKKLGISALIVMPRTTPAIKVEAVKSYGAEVELVGDNYSEAAEACKLRVTETGRTYIHPFDDPLVIAGQGTVGREILEQLPEVTHIFVPVGGGGLIAGIAQYVKALRPEVKVVAVEPEDSNCLQASLAAHERVVLPHVGIFADGVAVKQIGERTFAACEQWVDECLTVTTDELCAGIKAVFSETRGIVEPAGALGVAGITKYAATHDMQGAHMVAICSGANMSFERLQFVAERTLLGSGQEALFGVRLPERPGALRQFCERGVRGHNISQFGYRLGGRDGAYVLVGVTLNGAQDRAGLIQKLQRAGYEYADLSHDEAAKEHIRHMVGGCAPAAVSERFYQVSFPERPGALDEFLRRLGDDWSISLFHYRGGGGDVGQVMIGVEVETVEALERRLEATGWEFTSVVSKAVEMFMSHAKDHVLQETL